MPTRSVKTTKKRVTRAKAAPVTQEVYSVHNTLVTEKLVPLFVHHREFVESTMRDFMNTKEMSKEIWTKLYSIVDDITKLYDTSDEYAPLIAFDRAYLVGKYHNNHSNFYNCHAAIEARYLLHQLELADKHPADSGYYINHMLIAAEHLFFFINMKEKLELTKTSK